MITRRVNTSGLKLASAPGVTVLSNINTIGSGTNGVIVGVGVSETAEVGVIVGVKVMVEVNVIVAVSAIVGVREAVGVGG